MARAPKVFSRRRLAWPETWLAVASALLVLAGVAAAELVLRWLDPRYLDRTRGESVYSETLGWKLRPGFEGWVHDTWTTVDACGHRGRHAAEGRAAGRRLVLMLGDSITFGHRVRDEQTFSALVAARTGRFVVINLGVEGYGTDQELIALQAVGLRHRPDVVVLNFCSNDVLNNALDKDHQDGRTPKPFFSLQDGTLVLDGGAPRLSTLRGLAQRLADESHLFGRLGDLVPPLRVAVRGGAAPDSVAARLARSEAIDLSVELIVRIAELSRQAGARFLLVIHADEPGLLGSSWLASRLRASPRLAGMSVLDMAERYRARGLPTRDVLLDYQGHLTPLGNLVAAQEIETALAGL
jgi:hypothetical protein